MTKEEQKQRMTRNLKNELKKQIDIKEKKDINEALRLSWSNLKDEIEDDAILDEMR